MVVLSAVRPHFQRSWFRYGAALCAVAAMTGCIGLVLRRVYIANISMLYLIVVLAAAVAFGSGPAVVASVAAFLTFDWFFVEPSHTFAVSDPEEWIALLLFLITAVITGQLTASVRRRAVQSEQREREAAILYDVARLLNDVDLHLGLRAVVDRVRQELQLVAVTLEIDEQAGGIPRISSGDETALKLIHGTGSWPANLLSEGMAPGSDRRGHPGPWVRIAPPRQPERVSLPDGNRLHLVPVRVKGRKVGALMLVHTSGAPVFRAAEDRILSAVAVHVGVAVERVVLQREANEAEVLRGADGLKSALINAVSHDLRTPLASIIASAGSLRQRDVAWTEVDVYEFAVAIEEEAQRLNRIVGNLLDLSRIEGGSLRPEKGWYDVGALIDDVLGRLRPLTSDHRLVVGVSDDLPPVSLDPVEIDQVLTNLIENAAKYSPKGTFIEISTWLLDDEIRIAVADQGPGIPREALSSLFKPFYQIEAPGARAKGAGVGLAVARGLIEAHGGRIWVEAPKAGGARFVFALPLPRPVVLATADIGMVR